MKNIYITGLLLILLMFNLKAQINWTLSSSGLPNNFQAYDFVVTSPNEIYAIGAIFASITMGNIYKSVDGGNSWTQLSLGGLQNHSGLIYSSGMVSNKILISAMGSGVNYGIYSSIDGINWNLSNNGIPYNYIAADFIATSQSTVYTFGYTMDPTTFAFTPQIYVSIDTGMSWNIISTSGLNPNNAFRAAAWVDNKFLLSDGFNIYSSSNGNLWALSNFGIPNNFETYQIIPISDADVYAVGGIYNGAWSSAIFKSSDGGVSWVQQNFTGISSLSYPFSSGCFTGNAILLGVTIAPKDNRIYRSDIGLFVNEKKDINKLILTPNPATELVCVNILEEGVKVIEVFNMQGELIKIEEFFDNSYLLSVEKFMPGIYYCIVRSSNGKVAGKLIKL